MAITLYHHPFSRSATTIWLLEEVSQEYTLEYVDIMAGATQKAPVIDLNPMGKVPVLVDGDVVVTEQAAIALYLGDRYGAGTLAPALDDPRRGPYLRWACFSPSVVEPAVMARQKGWDYSPAQAGWGEFDRMVETLVGAVAPGPYLLGDQFTMADTVVGGTARWLLQFGLLPKEPALVEYVDRLAARPALQKCDAINARIREERGLNQS